MLSIYLSFRFGIYRQSSLEGQGAPNAYIGGGGGLSPLPPCSAASALLHGFGRNARNVVELILSQRDRVAQKDQAYSKCFPRYNKQQELKTKTVNMIHNTKNNNYYNSTKTKYQGQIKKRF